MESDLTLKERRERFWKKLKASGVHIIVEHRECMDLYDDDIKAAFEAGTKVHDTYTFVPQDCTKKDTKYE